MANEIQLAFSAGKTVFCLIFNKTGSVWNTSTLAFEVYASASLANYVVSLTQQGTSKFYFGTFPTQITAGVYGVPAFQQIGGSPAESDPVVAEGDIQWNGTTIGALSDTATSGQVGQGLPINIYRGSMVKNFGIYLKSAADHITPFTSGVVSGQIARDGGSFGALQSGAFTEIGLGFFNTNLTSGDLLANSVKLLFTAVGISGGNADPLPMTLILQRTSGQ